MSPALVQARARARATPFQRMHPRGVTRDEKRFGRPIAACRSLQ
jgi:hypothetical protein